jgi:HPt (histidine-containing phosphotransfer) domain-containing protein
MAWGAGGHDLALIDIELPEVSGLDVIREIRAARGAAGRLPILAVTAYVLRSNREAIFSAGADGVLAKPLNSFGGFARAVAGLLRRTEPADAERTAIPVPDRPHLRGLYDRDTLRHLLGIAGPQGAVELLSRLRADLRATHRELADGLARADMPVIRAKTHVLISLAGAIGARELQTQSEQMNDAAHRRDAPTLQALGPQALSRLERLIEAVSRETAEGAP